MSYGLGIQVDGAKFNASLIVGGQIRGQRPRLFLVYPAGNFIEASEGTPYFQMGESKYGKPILERLLAPDLDLVTYRTDRFRISKQQRTRDDDP
jgi:putative proteasome-type protease